MKKTPLEKFLANAVRKAITRKPNYIHESYLGTGFLKDPDIVQWHDGVWYFDAMWFEVKK